MEAGGGAKLSALEDVVRHRFANPALLTLALTHRSFVYDAANPAAGEALSDPSQDNEQLEFLGDAVLGMLAAQSLCRHFPVSREGELTRLRASVISRNHLGEVGIRLRLGLWLRLGRTAEKNDGRTNPALFSNAIEALIAALYLDGGLEVARRFVEDEILAPALPNLRHSLGEGDHISGAVGDYKSALQEMMQAQGMGRPHYRVLEESGPDHCRRFRVEARWEEANIPLAEAEGSTKKQAQQQAARLAVAQLKLRSQAIDLDNAPGSVSHD